MLERLDDHYSELTYNGPKQPKPDWGAGTLRRAFFWPDWWATGPWRNMRRNEWFIEGGANVLVI